MTPQQTKLGIAGAVIVAVLAGTFALKSNVDKKTVADGGDATEAGGVDVRQGRINLSGGSGGNDSAGSSVRTGKGARGNGTAGEYDADIASIVDAATTQVQPIETEAETRERERYEEAMANQFKYRKLDPDKVKPVELTPVLETVSKEYGIPDNLMAALMFVETGGTHRFGEHSLEAGYGVMNLRENNLVDTLAEAASLVGKTKEEILYNQEDNVKAAGALLRSYYDDAIASGLSESEAWYSAVSTYSGRQDPELASHLADETAGMMMRGFETHLSDGGGTIVVPPTANPPFLPKNWELVGMTPPSGNQGASIMPGTTPPNAQGYANSGSAAGGAQVAP